MNEFTLNPNSCGMGTFNSKTPSVIKLNKLFDCYMDRYEENLILDEGIERLCQDLCVAPEDFRVLLLAWKLSAQVMCRFTRTEFVYGLQQLRVDSVKTLQARLPELVFEVDENIDAFKHLYYFTFRFGLDVERGERILPTKLAIALWRLVFTVHEPPILQRWLNYLDHQEQYRGISKDTWEMFPYFAEIIGLNLSSYDFNEAWPSIFDDFVEYELKPEIQETEKEKQISNDF